MEIGRKSLFLEVLKKYPREVKEVLRSYGLPCLECKGLPQETLEHIAVSNGLDVEGFIKDLKARIKGIDG